MKEYDIRVRKWAYNSLVWSPVFRHHGMEYPRQAIAIWRYHLCVSESLDTCSIPVSLANYDSKEKGNTVERHLE
jgi:hypothetical protein